MTEKQRIPAKYLSGKILNDQWKVGNLRTKNPNGTGGNFSFCYDVVNEASGQKAFLKALDFSGALASREPIKVLGWLSNAFDFEQNVLELCRDKRLTKIISLIDVGNISPEADSSIPVPFFILELASGDIYEQIDFENEIDHLLNLKTLHNVSTALFQLHRNGVAHQDIKPSNVLVMSAVSHKLGDLGRADLRGKPTPYQSLPFAGDPSYAPPEAHYKSTHPDWVFRRIASDAYQLGSLITFLYTQHSMTALLHIHLHPQHNWNNWNQTYREVLPYLHVALEQSVDYFKSRINDTELADDLAQLVFQLCDPDPTRRGFAKSASKRPTSISIEKYVTVFDRLHRKYRVKFFKGAL